MHVGDTLSPFRARGDPRGKAALRTSLRLEKLEPVMLPAARLQETSLFVARGFRHDAFAPSPLLSVKCMFNGTALYRADRAWFAVDGTGYLVLNDQQPYEIHIDSTTRVEAFIIFF